MNQTKLTMNLLKILLLKSKTRNVIFYLCILILSFSCQLPSYYQLHQIKSLEINNEIMTYEDNSIAINYNFWSEFGSSRCLFTNKTDSIILINMELSHFIYNGLATPYFTNKVTTSSTSTLNSKSTTYSNYKPTTYNTGIMSNTSFSISESKILIIPPKSSKYINGFSIGYFYKNCDYNPYKDTMVKSFDINNTPIKFTNLFYYNIGDLTSAQKVVKNNFYISQISTITDQNFIKQSPKTDCGKQVYNYYINVFNYQLGSRYFIKSNYQYN